MALDTRVWNIGAMVLGAGACGPLVPLPADTDGDGDTQSDDDDGPSDDGSQTAPTPTITTTPGGCNPACPPGYYCVDGICQYSYGTSCIGECGGYYECFSHDDCDGQTYCSYYACVYVPYVDTCDLPLAGPPELIPDLAGAVSLAFADVNGDGFEDLAAYAESGWVVFGPNPSAAVPIDLFGGGSSGDVVATEFDGAPPTELTFSVPDSDVLLTLSVVNEPQPIALSEPALEDPVAGDFNGDGRDDIAGRRGEEILYMLADGGQFGSLTEYSLAVSSPLATGLLGTKPVDILVYSDGFVDMASLWKGGGAVVTLEEQYPMAVRTPVVGDFDGNGTDDIVAIGERPGLSQALVATWLVTPDDRVRLPYVALPNVNVTIDGSYAAAAGDVDGDGTDDIAIGGFGNVIVMRAGAACYAWVTIDGDARYLAMGDFDGNGRDDIAWSDGVAQVGLIRPD